jgi:hypothetical protein
MFSVRVVSLSRLVPISKRQDLAFSPCMTKPYKRCPGAVATNATDLVGINGITRVLLVYTCQQGVYPRGHVLPLRLPGICRKIISVLMLLLVIGY